MCDVFHFGRIYRCVQKVGLLTKGTSRRRSVDTDRLSTGMPSWPVLNSALLHSIAMRANAIHVGELRLYIASAQQQQQ